MTIGALSRRTGVAVKTLREYEDMGLIYIVGRTPGNYRLFDDDALWCVGVVANLTGLGLTLAEIQGLAGMYLRPGDERTRRSPRGECPSSRAHADRRADRRSTSDFGEAVIGRSVLPGNIHGDEQLGFLAVLVAGLVFEGVWTRLRGTNAMISSAAPGAVT